MTLFITIRDIKTNQHQIIEYMICFIYIVEINKKDEKIHIIFNRELYIVDALKINILIDNDIMSAKDIFINLKKCTVIINSCNIIVFIKIKIFHDSAI